MCKYKHKFILIAVILLSCYTYITEAANITVPRSVGDYFADVNDSAEKLGTVGQVQLQSDISKNVVKGQPSTWLVVADTTSSNNGYWWWDGSTLYQSGTGTGGSSTPFYFPCESVGFSTSATPSANATALQSCLNAHTNVSVTAPGTYSYNWGQYIKADHALYIGNGVVLQQYAAPSYGTTSANFLYNPNYNATPVITTTMITAATSNNAGNIATLVLSGGVLPVNNDTGVAVAVGDYIQITGDTSNQYNNVFKILTVNSSTSTITFYVAGNTQTASTGTQLRVVASDSNITITGPGGGTIDSQGPIVTCPTSGVTQSSNLGGHGMIFGHTNNLHIDHINIVNTCNYGIDTANSFNATFADMSFYNTKACIQSDGLFYNVSISRVKGTSSYDDCFAFISGPSPGYLSIIMPDVTSPLNGVSNVSGTLDKTLMNGWGLTIENIELNTVDGFRFLQIDPDQVYGGMANIVVRDSAITFLNGVGSTVTVPQIQVNPAVNFTSMAYIRDVSVSHIQGVGFMVASYTTVDQYTIKDYNTGQGYAAVGWGKGDGSNGLFGLGGTVTQLAVEDANIILNTNNTTQPFISINSTGILNNAVLDNVYSNSVGSAASYDLIYLNGGTLNNFNYTNSSLNGQGIALNCSSTGTMGVLNATNIVLNGYAFASCGLQSKYNLNNINITSSTSAYNPFIMAYSGTGPITVNADNIVSSTSSLNFIFNNGTTNQVFNLNLDNILFPSGANIIRDTGTSGTFNVNVDDMSSTTTLWGAKGTTPTINTSLQGVMAKPVIASGFGTSPSIVTGTSNAFSINVGTGGTANSGVITMPTSSNGWTCSAINSINPSSSNTIAVPTSSSSITLQNYGRTTGTLTAWAASDVITVSCTGY